MLVKSVVTYNFSKSIKSESEEVRVIVLAGIKPEPEPNIDVSEFDKEVDLVVENPPFGVQNRKADKPFLEKAMQVAKKIYSIHKIESKNFIDVLCKENGFVVNNIIEFDFLMPHSQPADY